MCADRMHGAQADVQDIDAYLRQMGVKDPALRQRLETQLPGAEEHIATAASAARLHQPITQLNAARAEAGPDEDLPAQIVFCDANGSVSGLDALFGGMTLPAFAVRLPADDALWDSADAAELAKQYVRAIKASRPRGKYVFAGVGFGAVLAHEAALQLQRTSDKVQALAVFEGAHATRVAAGVRGSAVSLSPDIAVVAWSLYPLLEDAGALVSLADFAQQLLGSGSYDAQLDYIASFKPAEVRSQLCFC